MTERDTVKLLCKSIITRLENKKSITFTPRLRQVIQDELYDRVGPYIFTEQDLREKTLEKMGAKAEVLAEMSKSKEFAESDQYRAAKAVVKSTFGDDELNGFYFQRPLKSVAETVVQYFMRSSHIDDVFETDEDLEFQIIEIIRRFDANQLH